MCMPPLASTRVWLVGQPTISFPRLPPCDKALARQVNLQPVSKTRRRSSLPSFFMAIVITSFILEMPITLPPVLCEARRGKSKSIKAACPMASPIPAQSMPMLAAGRCWSNGASTEPAMLGLAGVPRGHIQSRAGRMRLGKCSDFFVSILSARETDMGGISWR